jgi:hypothetical protein
MPSCGRRVLEALAIRHVQIAQIVHVSHRRHKVVSHVDVEELAHVASDDEVGIEIEHTIIALKDFLNQEAVVRLHTDVRIIGGKIVATYKVGYVVEAQLGIGIASQVTLHCDADARRKCCAEAPLCHRRSL